MIHRRRWRFWIILLLLCVPPCACSFLWYESFSVLHRFRRSADYTISPNGVKQFVYPADLMDAGYISNGPFYHHDEEAVNSIGGGINIHYWYAEYDLKNRGAFQSFDTDFIGCIKILYLPPFDGELKHYKLFGQYSGNFRMVNSSGLEYSFHGNFKTQGYIPYWSLTLATSIPPLFMGSMAFLRNRRRKPNICWVCDYDLRASKDRCPECGTPIARKV